MKIVCNKYLILLLVMTLLLNVVCSCQRPAEERIPTWKDYFASSENYVDLVSHKDQYGNVKLAELSAYGLDLYQSHINSRNGYKSPVMGMVNKTPSDLSAYNQTCPIEYIQILDDDRICVICRVEKNDERAYAYSIWIRDGDAWIMSQEYYFLSQAVNSKAYAHIEVGDKLNELYDIDPAIVFDIRPYDITDMLISGNPHCYQHYWSVRLLTDGIIIYQFRCDVPGQTGDDPEALLPSSYKITDITFYEYGNADISGEKIPLTILQYLDKLEFPS